MFDIFNDYVFSYDAVPKYWTINSFLQTTPFELKEQIVLNLITFNI